MREEMVGGSPGSPSSRKRKLLVSPDDVRSYAHEFTRRLARCKGAAKIKFLILMNFNVKCFYLNEYNIIH